MTIAMVQGRDAQVEAALRLTFTQGDLRVRLGLLAVVCNQLGPYREDLGERLADRLRSCMACEALSGPVKIHDPLLLVHDDHGITHAFDDLLACHRDNI